MSGPKTCRAGPAGRVREPVREAKKAGMSGTTRRAVGKKYKGYRAAQADQVENNVQLIYDELR
jgi:hypothetical protein